VNHPACNKCRIYYAIVLLAVALAHIGKFANNRKHLLKNDILIFLFRLKPIVGNHVGKLKFTQARWVYNKDNVFFSVSLNSKRFIHSIYRKSLSVSLVRYDKRDSYK